MTFLFKSNLQEHQALFRNLDELESVVNKASELISEGFICGLVEKNLGLVE